eukprot:sb/3467729/
MASGAGPSWSVVDCVTVAVLCGVATPPNRTTTIPITLGEPTETSKQPIRTRYLGHVIGYQPIRGQYFLIRSVPVIITCHLDLKDAPGEVDLSVAYDVEELGCPIIWPFDQPFTPDVWIYDGEEATRVLEADYILDEVNSRFDYNYTMTHAKMGCRRDTPPREDLIQAVQDPDTNTYQTCFDSETVTLEGKARNLQYEIMNSTGVNTILFSKHKANYTFTLTVVDPRSSYCHLSTKFAVSSYLTDKILVLNIVWYFTVEYQKIFIFARTRPNQEILVPDWLITNHVI